MTTITYFIKKSLAICLVLVSSNVIADSNTKVVDDIIKISQEKNLASHTAWQRLLYYQGAQSRVINPFNTAENTQQFFITKDGATNPKAELHAMLQALLSQHDANLGDNSVQCRFPARTAWLKQQLNLTFSPAKCQDFDEWLQKINPMSVSLVFANEYLDNPASAFAHIFLRFDNHGEHQYYLNYAPKTQQDENIAKLAYQTTISGHAGEFTINHYDKSIKKYLHKEGRDIWQFKLNLNQAQTLQLAKQVYEIKNQTLPYYLLDENCASEILTLLNTLFPNKNYLSKTFMVAPSQMLRQLQDDGLITNSQFTPSIISQNQSQKNTFETALLNSGNPLNSHALSRIDMGYISRQQEDFIKVGYRLVYHDMLDKPNGYLHTQTLNALDVAVRIGEKHTQLEHATLINMQNFKPTNTAKTGKSWSVDVGLKQAVDNIDNDEHLVTNAKFGYGFSQAFGKPLAVSDLPPNFCYQLGTVANQAGKGLDKGYRLGVGVDLGCYYQFGSKVRGMASLSLPYWFGNHVLQPKIDIGMQFDIGKNQAIRINAEKQWLKDKALADQVGISYLRYFE